MLWYVNKGHDKLHEKSVEEIGDQYNVLIFTETLIWPNMSFNLPDVCCS